MADSASICKCEDNRTMSKLVSTPGTMPGPDQAAILIESLNKSYGSVKVLDNFYMTVPTGAIYSLLGSSGCGKTTLLNCVAGLKNWDSGTISVFGNARLGNNDDSTIKAIGRKLGYMPQDFALYDHLKIKEIIKYFCQLYGMSEVAIIGQMDAVIKLLDLENKCHLQIGNLSGGQKRRVSLALALVSKPDLLLLDEPTVGLDPVLRRSIWHHLHQLVSSHKTTVLITTHYIEESKYSNKIGIMRNGRMLMEESPQHLLSTFKCNYLQDVILTICKSDDSNSQRENNLKFIPPSKDTYTSKYFKDTTSNLNGAPTIQTQNNVLFRKYKEIDPDEHFQQDIEKSIKFHLTHQNKDDTTDYWMSIWNNSFKSFLRTKSFSTIMWIFLVRQPIFAFILVFMPAVQLFMTFFIVGKQPTSLNVGLINYETNEENYDICGHRSDQNSSCDLTLLSCQIENYLSISGNINLVPIRDIKTAQELLQQGTLFGYFIFPRNYSENLVNRQILGKFATDYETLEGSRLTAVLDKSHYLAYHLIIKEVIHSLEKLSDQLGLTCGYDSSYNEVPLHFREPVYGKLDGTHQDSIMTAIVGQILFEILYGIAPMILIQDWRQGTFERSRLAGLHFSEFMLGIFLTMFPILIIQSITCYIVFDYGFQFGVQGSLFLFLFLCILAGLCGQGFGIFIGILVKSEFAVIVSAIMIIPILMTCSGTLWPLEAHPPYLKIIYYIFPSAPIVSSLRSVINRGVGITHLTVWPGIVNTSFWSLAFWVISIYGYKRISRES